MERFLKRKLSSTSQSVIGGETSSGNAATSTPHTEKQVRKDAFITEGFCSWNNTERLAGHVGDVDSFHNKALKQRDELMRLHESVTGALHKQSDAAKNECRNHLSAQIHVFRHLMQQSLPYGEPDELDEAINGGIFLEMMKYAVGQNEDGALGNAPIDDEMTSLAFHKDIAHCFAQEIIHSIVEEIGDDVFGLLVGECSDISDNELMLVVLRYVDKLGLVKERFVGVVHFMEISSLSLKGAVDSLFAKNGLSLEKVRSQSYDGTGNMHDEFNGLSALIMRENRSAYYVHCFAHQFQQVVVAVAENHFDVVEFIDMISIFLNVVRAPCKRKDLIRESQLEEVKLAISSDEIEPVTLTELRQEVALQRPGATCSSNHYKTLLRLVELYSCVLEVLEYIKNEGTRSFQRGQAHSLLIYFQSYDFVFNLQLMLLVLGLTDPLSLALQRKDQDLLNAISLVKTTKRQLQKVRDDGWDSLFKKVSSFCEKHEISMVNMEEEFSDPTQPRRRTNITNLHHYMVDCFYSVVDLQLQELNGFFDEVNSELLICVASLSPSNLFREFDPSKLMRLAELYPDDFSFVERMTLEHQLSIYIDNVRGDVRFANLESLSDLARVMVDTRKHASFPLVYRLLKLALILPVTAPHVERSCSAMKAAKANLRNQVGDEHFNDRLICFIEKQLLATVTYEVVTDRFENMKTRTQQL